MRANAAAVQAVLHVDVEGALKQPCPAETTGPQLGALGLALGRDCGVGALSCLVRILGHLQQPQLGVGRQHPVKPDQYSLCPGTRAASHCPGYALLQSTRPSPLTLWGRPCAGDRVKRRDGDAERRRRGVDVGTTCDVRDTELYRLSANQGILGYRRLKCRRTQVLAKPAWSFSNLQ
jgi:hypothetical protein